MLGRTMMECYPGIEATAMFARIRRCMETRTHDRMENEFTYPDGSKGHFELRFVPVPEGTCVLSLDITEAKRTATALVRSQEQLQHAQKMEAVGRLAGGVAHDFNNLLSVIMSYASLAQSDLPTGDPMSADLDEIVTAAQRAADLTRQLLAFSRPQAVAPRIIDLNAVLAGTEKMVRRLVGEDIHVRTVLAADLGRVRLDPGQVEQVLMNLVVNARDAMPGGGSLVIETGAVELDAEFAGEHLGVTPGPHVMLAVSDTGTGIAPDVRARIFEPFFTTKDVGKGTGLGLSTVFGIVRQNRGTIWVYSEPGRGAMFKVYFPRCDEDATRDEPAAPPRRTSHDETVLLVEDDDQLRTVAVAVLRRAGYTTLEARNGGEALIFCEQHEDVIDLLLTDVVMPHLNGPELAERLTRLRPGMRVLFMSGYSRNAAGQAPHLGAAVPRLEKPFSPDALLRMVRGALDERAAS
jgi:signal transduction histidine kinase/CheY-like chemotaxis protein